jgi:nucleoside-diphosphate-sugar epimerase
MPEPRSISACVVSETADGNPAHAGSELTLTILITGGTGFLGAYFARYAIKKGERVVIIDRYADRGRIADILAQVTLIEGDVSDSELLAHTIAEHDVERIAHFAFILGSPKPGQMLPYVQVQCLGTANVFEAARVAGVRRVLFASSVAAYGRQQTSLLTEDLVPNPSEPYGTCKAWGEAMGRHYSEQLGLDVVSLRFGSTYGHGRGWRGSYNSGLLATPEQIHYMARVDDATRGKAIQMPRDDAIADWTYAGDAAQAAWLALTAQELTYRLYNVQAKRGPIGEFTSALRKLLPEVEICSSETEVPGHAHPSMSNERLVKDLGFSPAWSFDSGLADYIERVRLYDRYHS